MKILGYVGPFLILLFGMFGLIVSSSFKKDPATSVRSQQSALVEVTAVQDCTAGFSVSVDGEVVPFRQISLAAEVSGRIAKKSLRACAGNYVRAGDMLFDVDARDYEIEVRRLRETVKQAGSSLEELDVEQANVNELISLSKEQLALQRTEVKRFRDLRSKNATSTSQLDSIRKGELQALNALQALKNQISLIRTRRQRLAQEKARAITGLDQAELNLQRTKIVSPIDGVVIQDLAEQDDFVQPGTLLIRLEDTSKVEIRFSLRMEQLRWLWNSDYPMAQQPEEENYTYDLPKIPLEVHMEMDGMRFAWPARLDRYDGAGITAGTRTVPVIAVVEDPTMVRVSQDADSLPLANPPTLLRGSYVTVEIPVGQSMGLVSIPPSAFQPNNTVWVFDQGTLRVQKVQVAYSDQDQVLLLTAPSQLSKDDLVITSPLPIAESGMAVRLPGESADPSHANRTVTAREPSNSEAM